MTARIPAVKIASAAVSERGNMTTKVSVIIQTLAIFVSLLEGRTIAGRVTGSQEEMTSEGRRSLAMRIINGG